MKRLTYIMAAAVISLFLLTCVSAVVHAQAFDPLQDSCAGASDGGQDSVICQDKANGDGQTVKDNQLFGKNGIMTKGANILSIIVGIASVIMIVVSGLKFVTAGGDANQISAARRTTLFSAIGVLVALFAQAMIFFVLDKL